MMLDLDQIICDDSLNVMSSIDDNSVDMILTDPPYNTTSLKLDKQSFDLSLYMEDLKRVLKPNGWSFVSVH